MTAPEFLSSLAYAIGWTVLLVTALCALFGLAALVLVFIGWVRDWNAQRVQDARDADALVAKWKATERKGR